MINSLINKNYFLSKKLQKDIFAIICTKKINTEGGVRKGVNDFTLHFNLVFLCHAGITSEIQWAAL